MADCENEVYTKVAQALRSEFTSINIAGDVELVASKFPTVYFYQSDDSTYERLTTDSCEKSQLVFTAEVYSNDKSGKKTQAKNIMKVIDAVMFGINAVRLSKLPVPNRDNPSIYRLVARYRVITDDNFFYRR